MRFLGLILLFAATSSSAQTLEVCFIGNAAVQITDGKVTLVSDFPYKSGAFGYMEYSWDQAQPKGEVLSLITHRHDDHFEASLLAKTNWKVIAPADAAAKVPSGRLVPIKDHAEFQGIQIAAIVTPHAKVDHYSYLIAWHGKRFYFTGDTESTDQLLAQRNLDSVFVTPWLIDSVLDQNKQIDAQHWIVYHHTSNEKVPENCPKCKLPKQAECWKL